MASDVVYVVAIGEEAPVWVVIEKSLRESMMVARNIAAAGIHATATAFEVDLKDESALAVRMPLVENHGLTPLALNLGMKQVPRQIAMEEVLDRVADEVNAGVLDTGETQVTARVLNPAMRGEG